MIAGEDVVVERPQAGPRDGHNQSSIVWAPETVPNVLVAPGPRSDLGDPQRPDGVNVVWNLHFPKGYPATLRGARIRVRGQEPCAVIGDPQHYTSENTPGPWSLPVEVSRADG